MAVLFEDNFNDGNMTGWTHDGDTLTNAGTWAVGQSSNTYAKSHAGNTAWTDYEYLCDIWAGDNDYQGILFRRSSSTLFYLLEQEFGNSTTLLRLMLNNSFDAGGTVLGSANTGATTSTWYTLKVIVIGSSIKCYFSTQANRNNMGNPVITVTNTTHTNGNIGLSCDSQSGSSRWDNVLVNSIDKALPLRQRPMRHMIIR